MREYKMALNFGADRFLLIRIGRQVKPGTGTPGTGFGYIRHAAPLLVPGACRHDCPYWPFFETVDEAIIFAEAHELDEGWALFDLDRHVVMSLTVIERSAP